MGATRRESASVPQTVYDDVPLRYCCCYSHWRFTRGKYNIVPERAASDALT